MAIGIAVDDGLINVKDPLHKYIPRFNDGLGSTITVESVNTTLNDNILTLNKFTATETQTNGIPATKNSVGGIEIDRGNYANAKFLFDENISWTHGGTTTQGTFKITTEEGSETLLPLYTSGIKSPSTLYVLSLIHI